MFQAVKSVLRIGWRKPAFQAFQFCSYYRHSLVDDCLVPKFHYCKQPMNFGSRGSSELRVSPGHSSRIRHRNAFTQKPFTHTCFKIQTTVNMVKYPEGHLPWYPQTRENHFCAKKQPNVPIKFHTGEERQQTAHFRIFD